MDGYPKMLTVYNVRLSAIDAVVSFFGVKYKQSYRKIVALSGSSDWQSVELSFLIWHLA